MGNDLKARGRAFLFHPFSSFRDSTIMTNNKWWRRIGSLGELSKCFGTNTIIITLPIVGPINPLHDTLTPMEGGVW